jgi:hypothetical protein
MSLISKSARVLANHRSHIFIHSSAHGYAVGRFYNFLQTFAMA